MDPPRNVAEWLSRYRWTPRTRREDARSVPEVLRWLGQQDADQHVEWGVPDARRLLFARWLAEHGRLDQVSRDPSVVFVRTHAGKIHRATRLDGRLLTDEGDNLDDVVGGKSEITFAELERADPGDLCQRCWPPVKPDAELGE